MYMSFRPLFISIYFISSTKRVVCGREADNPFREIWDHDRFYYNMANSQNLYHFVRAIFLFVSFFASLPRSTEGAACFPALRKRNKNKETKSQFHLYIRIQMCYTE